VVIGGKNKYIINGHTVQQSQVANLFHSVQLNVNNPHFLIMQGRITKVLNMKPAEILSMIEEAAGTRMFETKKQAAIKTIEKKQLKVDEITKCIDEEITPTLENLRTERQDYHTWQANNAEFERLERFCIAFEFCDAEDKVKTSEADHKQMQLEHDGFVETQNSKQAAAQDCTQKVLDIERRRDAEVDGELQKLKNEEADLSKNLVKINTLSTNMKETIATENESLKALQKQIADGSKQIAFKEEELSKVVAKVQQKELDVAQAEQAHSGFREKYQNACAGVADADSAELLSLPEQVSTWEKKEREAQSGVRQCQQRIEHIKEVVKELRKNNKTQSQTQTTTMQEMDLLRSKITEYENKLRQFRASDADEANLRSSVSDLRSECSRLHDEIESMTVAVETRLNFEFKDPEKGFDRSKVKGLVAKLVHVQDARVATALEIAAGAKLYQVVVDTETTGKMILQKGALKKRVTILPLNKINAQCTSAEKMRCAQQIARAEGGTATLALELVGYDEEVRKAIEYVFGTAIVCDSSDVAKAIAFDKNVRTRTVTLDGDTFDPAGTMTGGSKNQLGALLSKMHDLDALQSTYKSKRAKLQQTEQQLNAIEAEMVAARDILAELDIKKLALSHCEEKIADSSYAQTMAKINTHESELVALEQVTSSRSN
jgi:structural maintenance of chromosome 2